MYRKLFLLFGAVLVSFDPVLCVKKQSAVRPQQIVSLDDYQRAAREVLRPEVWKYLSRGNFNDLTLRRNRQALNNVTLYPRYLRDVSIVDTTSVVLGKPMDYPFSHAPVCCTGIVRPNLDLEVAAACEELGNIFVLSYWTDTRLEDIARVAPRRCRKWMQIYVKRNRTQNYEVVRQAEQAGFEAIVLTIDLVNGGAPYSDRLNRFDAFVVAPAIYLTPNENFLGSERVDPRMTWDVVQEFKQFTRLKVVVKSIITSSDAAEAMRAGADALYISNHGGRSLDTIPAPIEMLPDIMDIVKASGRDVDVYADSGIRTGLDALKLYAHGVKMVFMGRPQEFAASVNSTSGVVKAFDSVVLELTNAMQLAGYPVLSEISEDLIRKPTLQEALRVLQSPLTSSAPSKSRYSVGRGDDRLRMTDRRG